MTILSCLSTVEQKSFEIYQASLTPLTSTFPCDEENIMKKHEQGMKEAIEIFRKETLMDSDIENFGANLKEFTVLIHYLFYIIIYIIKQLLCFLVPYAPMHVVSNSMQWRRQNDNWGGGGEYSYMCVLLN